MKLTLCLLTYNELVGCKHDIPKIKKISNNFDEIYAIDGGSTDGTIEYLKEQNINVYIQPKNGLNNAVHYAIAKCQTEAIIFFHPKGSIPVEDNLKFKPLFLEGYDFIIGSRIIKGATNEEDSNIIKLRKWLTLLLSIFIALLYKKNGPIIWDVLHGFRGIKIEAYNKLKINDPGMVTIDIEMVVRSYKKKLKMIEFPTHERKRLYGSTHFKTIPTGIKIIEYLIREQLRYE